MAAYILQRAVRLILVLAGMSISVFILVQLIPGDVARAMLGVQARKQELEALRRALGLYDPIYVQYFRWLGKLLQGDWGYSLQRNTPVLPFVLARFGNTVILTVVSVFIATVIGLVSGVISAIRQYSAIDRISMVLALFGNSMPAFWLGLMAILIFSLKLGWFPVSGMWSITGERTLGDLVAHLVLPSVTLGIAAAAVITRITRSSVLEVIRHDYIRTAQGKGLSEWAILNRHVLKNALLPILTVIGAQFGFLLGGAVLTETVFSFPGIGLALYDAISFRDYPVVQGGVLVFAAAFALVNLVVDLLYAYIDPRIRYG